MDIPASFFNVSFNKAMAFGYKTDDVDEFVTQALQYIKDQQEEQQTLMQKLAVLASSLEKYREEEDSLRAALVGAQKLGDSILRDCRSKAEAILRDATARADKVTQDAALELERAQNELDRVQAETSGFKDKLFSLYRTHLDLINHIPSSQEAVQHSRTAPSPPPREEPQPEPPSSPEDDQLEQRSYDYPSEESAGSDGLPVDSYEAPFRAEPPVYGDEPTEEDEPEESGEEAYGFPEEDADDDGQEPAPEYSELYEEESYTAPYAYEEEPVPVTLAAQPEEDDTTLYAPRRGRAQAADYRRTQRAAFVPEPMVQMEFFDGTAQEADEDEFFEDSRSLRSVDLNRIPYFDDEDEDSQAVPVQSKHRISKKFGELKFGDSFSLTDD